MIGGKEAGEGAHRLWVPPEVAVENPECARWMKRRGRMGLAGEVESVVVRVIGSLCCY